jgi:nudix-type nucleoside diphosphatase (YffH/AdpP family)
LTDQKYSVRHKRRAYEGFMNLDLYDVTITRGEDHWDMVREVHDHGHGAAVLPFDPERRTALLVRQLRVPVHVAGGEGLFLEVAAGLTDPGETDPAETARREAAEELQCRIHDLKRVAEFYPIPGMVTERMACYLARYALQDRFAVDHTPDEDEVLEVEEWPLAELWRAMQDGRLSDGKSLICLMGLRLERPDLFE